ncbi:hypothetical protein DOTSEDRAFT_73338 [Dothistroma septosporum NZE10]|uniref:Yippee domain-containing protein n=1 Tax=Dothistroma septosporum (strain NZE10 / CBS 128990) TaxID=675120 RepID=N1PLN4_DOTSN|nr:hypothetical protein DOTSEDRAFT_73338 [Dothistroma septosporum NZE10]
MPFPSLASPPTLFPTYLVPSLPFRRRKSSTDSTASALSNESVNPTLATNVSYLSGHASHLRCARCLSDLALSTQIISKGFTGRHGRAYLVAPSTSSICPNLTSLPTSKAKNDALPNLPNTYTHKPVSRQLVTGAHTVGDISCAQCGSVLGWKYVSAEEESQKYKVGKFILETKRVCRSSVWESEDERDEEGMLILQRRESEIRKRMRSSCVAPPNELTVPEVVEFDSDDEDECDALFAGTWTPQLARGLKERKVDRRYIGSLEE